MNFYETGKMEDTGTFGKQAAITDQKPPNFEEQGIGSILNTAAHGLVLRKPDCIQGLKP